MRHAPLSTLVFAALAGCTGGDAGLGESCSDTSDCQSAYQCVHDICVERCQRSPQCGDGFVCDGDGICRQSDGKLGDACQSEVDCGPGLSCQIDGMSVDDNDRLRASCTAINSGRPAGSECFVDADCRNGTCALGHCTDLCTNTRDCAASTSCMEVPRVEAYGKLFRGCLPSGGNIAWTISVVAPTAGILLPVPSEASYASLVFEVDDPLQKVGATRVMSPAGEIVYKKCEPIVGLECTAFEEEQQYYANAVRHMPEAGQSILAMPSSPTTPLETGVYLVNASSFRPNGTETGSAIPKLTAVVRIGTGVLLDLHLHFLDLDQHPCQSMAFNNTRLEAASAKTEAFFQTDFLGRLRSIFPPSMTIGNITYDDIKDHPDLDGLDISNAGALLSLGADGKGINVFFVRTLSPVGLQAFGPGPGPAGLGGTRKSGIVIGVDTLCYRSWTELARLTAHEIGRYMGLYHNVEVDTQWHDPIFDSDDDAENLMFFSELGGSKLSTGQREILSRSPVLR